MLLSLFSPILLQLTIYLHPIVLGTVAFCLWILITFSTMLIQKQTISFSYATLVSVLILYTVMLVVLLFFRPTNENYGLYNLIPFSTIEFFLSGKVNLLISFYNLAANIVLFIPYGILLMIRKRKMELFGYIYLPFVIISTIEILQFYTHRGNLDIDDLILNMLGVFFGYLFYPIFKRVVKIST